MSDYPTYRVRYDSLYKRYNVERYNPNSAYGWVRIGEFWFKWTAIRYIKGWVKYDEKERNSTNEVVWGPYP